MHQSHGIAVAADTLRIAAEAIEAAASAIATASPARSFAPPPPAGSCFMNVSPPVDPADRARIQALAENPVLREQVYLLSSGVPFEFAFGLDDVTRAAWCAILREHRGEPVPPVA